VCFQTSELEDDLKELEDDLKNETDIKNKKFNEIENIHTKVNKRFSKLEDDLKNETDIKNKMFNEIHTDVNERFNICDTVFSELIKKFNEIENEIEIIRENVSSELNDIKDTNFKNKLEFNESFNICMEKEFNKIWTNIQYLQEDMQYQLLELKNNETNVKNNIVKTLKNINDIINYIDNHQINELIEQELKENRNSYKYDYAYNCAYRSKYSGASSTFLIYITAEPFKVLLKYFKSQCQYENHFPVFNMHILIEDNTNDLLKMQVEYKKNYNIKLPAVHELIERYNKNQQQQINIKMINETEDEYELRILGFCLKRVQNVYWYYKCSEKLFY
jgi:hypothetical protein